MRRLIGIALLLVVIACEPVTQPTTTTHPILPPPDPVASTTTTTSPTTTTRNDPAPHSYRGFLPDGTDFHARIRGLEREALNSVGGTFSYLTKNGPVPVGGVRYSQNPSQDVSEGFVDGILALWLDPWYVEVIFSDAVLEELGDDAEEIGTRSIRLDIQGQEPWPILELSPPFAWEGGDPVAWWKTFVITTGCDDLARLCTENRVLQVQSVDDIIEGQKGLTLEQIDGSSISTATLRRPYDAAYLDPGPLDIRYGADVVWTGDEMIVWGGKQTFEGLTTLVDGAAFDPETNEWRRIANFPLQGPAASRAIWTGDEMVVVSSQGTFGYDPEADAWRSLTNEGVVPSESHDRMFYADESVYVWASRDLINVLDLSTSQWASFDAPQSAHADPYFGVLRTAGDRIVAVVLGGGRCFGKKYFQRGDGVWEPWPDVSLAVGEYGDCSTANQSASIGGDLVIWEEDGHPSAVFSAVEGRWRDLPSVPLGGVEGPSGPVPMDARRFLVPRWDEGAIFDVETSAWTRVNFPGIATDAELVWTGAEFLSWGVFDSWRWTPSPDVIDD